MSENPNALIIDPDLLADIQRQCQQRAAELEAAQGCNLNFWFMSGSQIPPGSGGLFARHPPVNLSVTQTERGMVDTGLSRSECQ